MDFVTTLMTGVRTLPLVALPAALLIGVAFFNHNKLKRQFLGAIARQGIVVELGMHNRPYPHRYMLFRLPEGKTVEAPYAEGTFRDLKMGDELTIYLLSDGSATAVSFEDSPWGGKIKRQIVIMLLICVLLAFLFPFAGARLLRGARK